MSGMDRSAAEISIHALRVEGDDVLSGDKDQRFVFLSTPSGWRATCVRRATTKCTRFLSTPSGWRATLIDLMRCGKEMHFYPRPPGGGRRCDKRGGGYCYRFLSTPSGWRATRAEHITINDLFISIHALRVEGDNISCAVSFRVKRFLSTPSGWRATSCGFRVCR